tara:strand:+ start:78 stop:215 length:138 start_codon:yes stop_codon:yes gene_type:complete
MATKEDFLWTGSVYFMILYVASTAVLAPYVKKVTKDQSQAMDNFR